MFKRNKNFQYSALFLTIRICIEGLYLHLSQRVCSCNGANLTCNREIKALIATNVFAKR